ncbi:hypothetical protein FKM82_011527 [Ascaphus truei]
MKTFSESHKTVFVVDHCPYMAESCRQHVEFDMLTKNRTQGIIPLAPISKSLWTCAVESSMEYCRIMYDIFPFKKLLMAALAVIGPPNHRADPECCSILHGLVAAVEALCKITDYQHEARTLLTENADRVANRGRIICITNAKSDSHVQMLEDCVNETIHEHNKLAAGSDHLMQIQKCDLVLIHTYPVGDDSLVSDRSKKELSPVLTSEVHSVRAGRHLATKLNHLVQLHFDLASTSITNIPMKEEQHANTSANYDVELLHHKEAHVEFSKSELHYCIGTYRISPVDVNSRPSSCLTNFLLNGRSVLLEQPRKSGSKVISHMLSSHGGEIFLHVLSSSRSILEDPPSISEGCGGRVTDYRITDFGEFMRENRLMPFLGPRGNTDGQEIPLERAKEQLERHTRYWPMIISQTTIFNMQAVVPLASVIVKESLTEEDVLNCQKTIYNLVDMERKNDPLPISTAGTRGKGPKRFSEHPNKKAHVAVEDVTPVEKSKGPMSLLSLWSARINTVNSRRHQEFVGRQNSINNKAELYQHLKEENGVDATENGKASRQ